MRILLCIFLALGLLASADAAAAAPKDNTGWGRVYTVGGKVPVRENPSEGALTVRVLNPGQKVRVDFEEDGWAAVFDPAEKVRSEVRASGYVRLAELRSGARAEPGQRPEKSEASAKPEASVKPEGSTKIEVSKKTDKATKAEASDKGRKKEFKKPQQAQEFGEIRVPDRKLVVRAKRDKDSDFVRLLRPGQRVRVDFQEDGWFAVFDPAEKARDLSRAWGYGRDKYLIPEKDYKGEIEPAAAPAAPTTRETRDVSAKPTPKREAGDDEAVGYSVLERHVDHLRPLAPVVLRVRLEVQAPPQPEALRKVMREIWKAERRKSEDLTLEVLLPGMDKNGLAYGVARFHDDGRIREFWWRDVVLRNKR